MPTIQVKGVEVEPPLPTTTPTSETPSKFESKVVGPLKWAEMDLTSESLVLSENSKLITDIRVNR